ncbi:MAG: DsbA family protein, partial [Bradyrhizobiaceae bacterium]|nr:DsbA family protein [Bradyrhizobiaceae bacterium]
MITRRQLAMGTLSALALGALGAVGVFEGFTGHGGRAQAETFSVLELEAKGPLDDVVMGSPTAPVTMIEYASMTCPHCAHFTVDTFPKVKEKYIDTGKVKYIMREYPLDGLAAAAFMLARCAGPDKYYPLIETLFAEQKKWAGVREPLPPLLAIAKQAGFNDESFQKCIHDKDLLDKIQQIRNRAQQKFKVEATPTFYINGERYSGALTIEEIDKAVEPLLKPTAAPAEAPKAADAPKTDGAAKSDGTT